MSSLDFNANEAPDMLQLNMENISKELNDLIVTGEQEFGIAQQFPFATMDHLVVTSAGLQNQVPLYNTNIIYPGQQETLARNVIPTPKHFNYYMPLPTQLPVGNIPNICQNAAENQRFYAPVNYLIAGNNLSPSTLGSKQNLYSNARASPTYEFYYLRSHGENDKKSFGSNGSNRKIPKMSYKNYNQKPHYSSIANEEIKVDLSIIDLEINSKENSLLYHLFELLRDLHCAVGETPPTFESNSNSQFVETFAPFSLNKMSTLPSTLNIQNQVKQACRKLTIFICEMQRILSNNKMFDRDLLAECEYYLNNLQQYLNQLEIFKRIEMEHKRGQFLRDDVKVHAERLTLLLEYINKQIREVHIRIIAFDWYMGVKYRGEVYEDAGVKDKEIMKNSRYSGVINEILKLCNTTVKKSIEISLISSTELQNQQKSLLNAKPEMNTLKSSVNLINKEEDVEVNAKSLLNKNNIFMAFKPDQTRKAGINNATSGGGSGGNGHNRHPVFYIG